MLAPGRQLRRGSPRGGDFCPGRRSLSAAARTHQEVHTMTTLLAIGTRKGLWLARSEDRRTWTLDGPHLLMQEVAAATVDVRGNRHRVLATGYSEHWGPTVMWSEDVIERSGGSSSAATWHETDHAPISFPRDTGAALARVWQLQPDT